MLITSGDYWVGYEIAINSGYAAGVDGGPAVLGKGDWIYWEEFAGPTWTELTTISPYLDFNWNIRVVLSPANAETCPPATNVNAIADGTIVNITWDAPTGKGNGKAGEAITYGFEGDIDAEGWVINSLNTGATWEKVEETAYAAPHEGSFQMRCPFGFSDQDEWLISPEFTVPEGGNLNFWTYMTCGSINCDHYYVKVSTDNGATWTELWDASAQPEGENYYSEAINISLADYAGQNVKLAWHAVGTGGIWYTWMIDDVKITSGANDYTYTVTRDGVEIETGLTTTNYTDTDLANGTYKYCVKVVYADCTSASSCAETVTINNNTDDEVVINYDGNNFDAIGFFGVPFIATVRFTPDELASYYGNSSIDKVRFFIVDAANVSNLRVLIYGNGTETEPGELLVDEQIAQVIEGWNEFTLSTSLPLTSGDYWVGYEITSLGSSAGFDAGPMIPGKGGWVYIEGITYEWAQLAEFGLDFNWNIRAVLSDSNGEVCPPATNVQTIVNADNVTITWNAPVAKNRQDILFSDNFENVVYGETPQGWTAIDADGDAFGWIGLTTTDVSWLVPHSGTAVAGSFSWNGETYTPDNYLISPLVQGATSIKYFYSVNENYPADHYAVMISKTGTNVGDFQIVYEETPNGISKGGQRYSLDSKDGDKPMSPWIERTVELPEGTKYVAFRHYNCTDQNYITLDDITIYGGTPVYDFTFTVTRDGVDIATGVTTTSYIDNNVDPGTYNYCVEVVYADCTSEAACAPSTIVSIENENADLSVKVYPNPASDVIYVEGDVASVAIYNSLGQAVKSVINNNQIDVRSFENGIYYLTITGSNGSRRVEKVVIAK